MRNIIQTFFVLFASIAAMVSCRKSADDGTNAAFKLSYGDSLFYLKNQPADNLIKPLFTKSGSYTSYPKGLSINEITGEINIAASETGLRYRISFTASTGEVYTTHILIAGINYLDRFYNLSQHDSIAYPIYNADPSRTVPSGNYDVNNQANQKGLAVNRATGAINLKQCIRNGLFGSTPRSDEWEDIDIPYQTNDNSGNSLNKIQIIIYYYDTINEVPNDVMNIVQAHLPMVLGANHQPIPTDPLTARMSQQFKNGLSPALLGKPRPPCVIIIGH